jgi:iron complex transport system substrate-binding protein
MRTVSLLPAATEIVAALGMTDQLVGVSHECTYPDAVQSKPRVTGCEIDGNHLPSRAIDAWVSQRLAAGEPMFTLDEALLHELRPELILTQRLCDVCAPAYGSVMALAQTLPGPPRVLNLEPSTLGDILENIAMVADAMGVPAAGGRLIDQLQARIDRVRAHAAGLAHRPRVAVIEWLDPVFCSGHWTPELVDIAGGVEVLGRAGQHSVRKTWLDVVQAAPEILVIACCGQPVARAMHDWEPLARQPEMQALAPVRTSRVHVVDGDAYFSRPGPRVVDALEILADIVHPSRDHQGAGHAYPAP